MNRKFVPVWFAMLVCALGSAGHAPAFAAPVPQVKNIQIGYDGNQTTRVVIDATADLDYAQSSYVDGGLRFVLDFDHLIWSLPASGSASGEGTGVGGIQRFRYAQFSSTVSRLVFDLDQPMIVESAFTMGPRGGDNLYRIVIDFRSSDIDTFKRLKPIPLKKKQADTDVSAVVVQEATARTVEPRPPLVLPTRPVVVIDAGHGGRDPGAPGTNGAIEKAVTLRAALKLRDLLEASGKYDVILTRETDVYVEHEDRIAIARNADADLFISLHADAAGNDDISGASVYTLSKAGDNRMKTLQNEEGWGIPLEVAAPSEEVEEILVALLARETQTHSSDFAEILIPELAKAGPVLRNTHRRGNLFVLLSPNVPAVLVEIGFLTNAEDEKRLESSQGLTKSMGAVKSAIDRYFELHKPASSRYGT